MRLGAASLAVLLLTAAGCGRWADKLACGDGPCAFTNDEWALVQRLSNISQRPPRPDSSNKYLPIVDWRTRAVTAGADQETDGTLMPAPWLDIPEVHLGWRLYHEPALSGSVSDEDTLGLRAPSPRPSTCGQVNISCKTCHDPLRYGADRTSVPNFVSIGAGWYDVNGQQTLNVAYFPVLYWNGRTDTVWAQAAQVIESKVSMNGHRMKTFWVINSQSYWPEYAQVFADTAPAASDLALTLQPPAPAAPTQSYAEQYDYDDLSTKHKRSPAEQEVVTQVHVNVAKAIAAYEWLLRSDDSPFDRFVASGGRSSDLPPAAQRGLKLFIGRASCIDCHNTPLFSDGRFHNIGIPQTGDHVPTPLACGAKCDCSDGGTAATCSPAGAHAGQQKLTTQVFRRGRIYDDYAASQGTVTPADAAIVDDGPDGGTSDAVVARQMGAWRTPSLRDVAMTAPYMHDGLFPTLADVIWHYDQGGGEGSSLGTSELSPLHLSAQDRNDLVAFLERLTGQPGPDELIHPPDAGLMPAVTCPPPADGGTGDGP